MLRYILKRILLIIPMLGIISLLSFIISISAPGDPADVPDSDAFVLSAAEVDSLYCERREQFGLDKSIFYCSFTSLADPGTLHKICFDEHRHAIKRLIDQYGNWQEIKQLHRELRSIQYTLSEIMVDERDQQLLIDSKQWSSELLSSYDVNKMDTLLSNIVMEFSGKSNPDFLKISTLANKAQESKSKVIGHSSTWKNYIPALYWHGSNNQFHFWLFGDRPFFGEASVQHSSSGFIRGDFGLSTSLHRPVASLLWPAITTTLMFSLTAVLLIFLLAIPLGVQAAIHRDNTRDRVISGILFVLYSLPNFWIALLLMMFFGEYLDWLPVYGLGEADTADNWWAEFIDISRHMILPVICLTYPSLAFVSRQVRGGMVRALSQDFVKTAYSKGLPNYRVIWKHAFRNALIPLITIIARLFPFLIGGSVVLEMIFSLPGMGKLGLTAFYSRDYPVVITILMFSAILTLIGYLVADILYKLADPRITYDKTN